MSGDDQDESQKTEEPTQKRLDDAQEKGNVPIAREINHFLILSVLTILVIMWMPQAMKKTFLSMRVFIQDADLLEISHENAVGVLIDILQKIAPILLIPMIILAAVVVVAAIAQNGFRIVPSAIMPKASRISIVEGFKRLFSSRSLVDFIKGLVKLILVGSVAVMAINPLLPMMEQLISGSLNGLMIFLQSLSKRVLIGAAIVMAVLAVLDLIYERLKYRQNLRMSRQDIRDEYKQTEGSPEIKSKLRELRQERARNRMMQAVPEADVVITNPTHFAIALAYNMERMAAPKVVAKGQDFVALKIREIAEENEIPIVENPPLAQALYRSADIDEEIPLEHYQAVADVIRYVYALKNKKL